MSYEFNGFDLEDLIRGKCKRTEAFDPDRLMEDIDAGRVQGAGVHYHNDETLRGAAPHIDLHVQRPGSNELQNYRLELPEGAPPFDGFESSMSSHNLTFGKFKKLD